VIPEIQPIEQSKIRSRIPVEDKSNPPTIMDQPNNEMSRKQAEEAQQKKIVDPFAKFDSYDPLDRFKKQQPAQQPQSQIMSQENPIVQSQIQQQPQIQAQPQGQPFIMKPLGPQFVVRPHNQQPLNVQVQNQPQPQTFNIQQNPQPITIQPQRIQNQPQLQMFNRPQPNGVSNPRVDSSDNLEEIPMIDATKNKIQKGISNDLEEIPTLFESRKPKPLPEKNQNEYQPSFARNEGNKQVGARKADILNDLDSLDGDSGMFAFKPAEKRNVAQPFDNKPQQTSNNRGVSEIFFHER